MTASCWDFVMTCTHKPKAFQETSILNENPRNREIVMLIGRPFDPTVRSSRLFRTAASKCASVLLPRRRLLLRVPADVNAEDGRKGRTSPRRPSLLSLDVWSLGCCSVIRLYCDYYKSIGEKRLPRRVDWEGGWGWGGMGPMWQ